MLGLGLGKQLELCSEAQLRPSSLRFDLSCETASFIQKLRQTRMHHGFAPKWLRGLGLSLQQAESCSLICQVGLDGMGSGDGKASPAVGTESTCPSRTLPSACSPVAAAPAPMSPWVTPCPGQALCPGIAHRDPKWP